MTSFNSDGKYVRIFKIVPSNRPKSIYLHFKTHTSYSIYFYNDQFPMYNYRNDSTERLSLPIGNIDNAVDYVRGHTVYCCYISYYIKYYKTSLSPIKSTQIIINKSRQKPILYRHRTV